MMVTIPQINLEATGRRINHLRRENDITVEEMGHTLGVSPQAVYKWMRGNTLPTVDNLLIIATLFNVRIDDILVLR